MGELFDSMLELQSMGNKSRSELSYLHEEFVQLLQQHRPTDKTAMQRAGGVMKETADTADMRQAKAYWVA